MNDEQVYMSIWGQIYANALGPAETVNGTKETSAARLADRGILALSERISESGGMAEHIRKLADEKKLLDAQFGKK